MTVNTYKIQQVIKGVMIMPPPILKTRGKRLAQAHAAPLLHEPYTGMD